MFVRVNIYEYKQNDNDIPLTKLSIRELESSEWRYKDHFYAIKSEYRPIPVYTYFFCIRNSKEYPFQTEGIDIMYDYYGQSKECNETFISWATPIPFTTPLFFYKNIKGLYITFTDHYYNKKFEKTFLSPIYVLTDTIRHSTVIIKQSKMIKWFDYDSNGDPNFTFTQDNGRCYPDPNGKTSLDECNKDIFVNRKKMLSLAEKLQENDNKREEKEIKIKNLVFSNIVVYTILASFVFVLIKLMIKNN